MANLDLTTTQWIDIFKPISTVVSLYHFARYLKDMLTSNRRTYILICSGLQDRVSTGYLTCWKLYGIKIDENTDRSGFLYPNLSTTGGANRTVDVYKDNGRTQKVASGSRDNDGKITLSEENDSGISGSVYVEWFGANSALIIQMVQNIFEQISALPNLDQIDSRFKEAAVSQFNSLTSQAEGILSTITSLIQNELITYIAGKIKSNKLLMGGSVESVDSDGVVTSEFEGIIADLIDAMEENTTPQYIYKGFDMFVIGTVTADPGNVGSGAWTGPSLYEDAIAGRYVFECVTDIFGSEQFEVTRIEENGDKTIAENYLTVDETYLSEKLGISSAKLQRTVTDTGTEADHFSGWEFDGETENNTDDGKLYAVYTASNKTMKLYKDSSRTDDYLVASGYWEGVLPKTIAFQEENYSGLTGSVDVIQVAAADPADTSDLEITMSQFAEKDLFYVDISRALNYEANGRNALQMMFGAIFNSRLPDSHAGRTIHEQYGFRGFLPIGKALFDWE